ncbi:hypothetical protein FDB15_18585 [Clostridium botulinum]|uniref:hypothetical protein n=1 Tax=unclassified Clostridium TaxID=2614128 RepID=UPI0013CAFE67|nr:MULTISPECIES: hypothetical protein [unclassified Clostridium]MBY7009083.1 hypothetical protein [Clostridium botulinum]NFH71569.1 hypothetical protein [Clostridium botulinum]NFI02722.1 hypothetical protein [Clostridium botulinum]NFI65171.1 hypothetical protein [Clostridium botulinum]NFI80312.1 hypothetical protein [Clostridium botulinum]
MILAIDPGNIESGYVIVGENLEIWDKGKVSNYDLMHIINDCIMAEYEKRNENINIAIEMIASYGMPVGAEVFETCVWIGRFKQELIRLGCTEEDIKYIYRKDEKMNLCQSMKANDATIKQALVDRFARGQKNYGKGTKKEPGWFYGFAKDIWAAYAVAVTYKDMYLKDGINKNE